MTATDFAITLEQYVLAMQLATNSSFARCYPTQRVPQFSAEMGRRYVRIVRADTEHSRSVVWFVDATNGDLLRANGWKAPLSPRRGGIRGNIFRLAPTPHTRRDAANDNARTL